jgi:hypothetical protein
MTSEHPGAAAGSTGRRMRDVSAAGLILKFFTSAVTAMLLFEAPALGVASARIHTGPQPDGAQTVPAGGPSGGEKKCRTIDKPRMRQYLNGEACPPVGFPYEPKMVRTADQTRMIDPDGACSSGPIRPNRAAFDFRVACQTHDYGYDLLRHLKKGGGRRRAVDLAFREDTAAECAARPGQRAQQCLRAAELAYRAVKTSSDLLRYRIPSGTAEA